MITATAGPLQDKCSDAPSIDSLASDVAVLNGRLTGNERVTSRELRALWSQRLRPFWRMHVEMYRALARRFLELGDNYLASEVADEAEEFFGDDVPLILTRALATARCGAPQAAQELLRRKERILRDATEAKSLLARTFKDLWKSSGEEHYLRESFELYHLDYTTTKGDRTFPGVNAASMALFLGRVEDARRIARDVLTVLRGKPDATGYWDRVTVAECLLVDGQIDHARTAYAEAAGAGNVAHAHLATTRAQARLLLRQLGRNESEFDACFPLPGVIAFTGHRIDEVDRGVPRFPAGLEHEVKERIRQVVQQAKAGFGYAAAANGADILFLEVMEEAGLETYVHLPLPEEDFIRESVVHSAFPDWLARYRAVTANATEFTCAAHSSPLAFDYGNRLLFGAACQRAQQLGSEVRLLAVWDGRPGDGAGGTADYIRLARESGRPVDVINLPAAAETVGTPLPSRTDEPEQLLSILTLSLAPDDEVAVGLATLLKEADIVHREVSGRRVRLFFRTPAAAAQAAAGIARQIKSALGLHTGPVRFGTHPLTGDRVIRGEHAGKSDELAALNPPGVIYASHAFAALLGLHPLPGARCEFLGYRALRAGASREPLFQLRS